MFRRLPEAVPSPGPTVHSTDGRELVCFSSNNYLGLASHPSVIRASADAVLAFGAGSTGSRLLSGNLRLHEELEVKTAQFKGAESALLFGSGFAANLGILGALTGPGDLLVCDKLNHASLIDGARTSGAEARFYRHLDYERAAELLSHSCAGQKFLVSDAVFSMDGDLAHLPTLLELCDRHHARLILDEAHSTGVLGPTGRGLFEYFGITPSPSVIRMGTYGKALGSYGAFVACDRLTREKLINHARTFIFSTALPPAVLGASLEALRILTEDSTGRLNQLATNIRKLRNGLAKQGWISAGTAQDPTPIIPILIGDADESVNISSKLRELGIIVPAIRPPSVAPGSSRLRMSVMATHTDTQIDFTLGIFNET